MRVYKRVEMLAATSFIYFLAVNGLRSAVILAMELLKQERLPYLNESLLPRSKTIQDLCVFTTGLSDLDSVFGDRELCEKGRELISRVLDTILSPLSTADRRNHVSMSTQQLGTNVFNDDTFPDLYVPDVYPMTDYFNYGTSAPVSAPDHAFRQWLENIDVQDWIL